MVPVQDADPVLIGNKVESIVPYLMSDEFVVDAKEDGKVIDIAEGFCIIEYKSGKRQAINISDRVQKNSSAGFWVDNTLITDLKIGDKFKQGDILAYNNKHFTKNREDNGASMNLGVLCKIAISSQWDVFEDSAPISKRLSEKLTTEMVDEKSVTFSPYTYIDYIAKVGDSIKAGEPLIVFSDAMNEEIQRALNSMRDENKEDVIQSAKTTISSKYTGEIVDVRVYTTSELDQLDPSLRAVVEEYWNRIKRKNDILSKYANDGDLEYYKAGQVISEVAEVVNPGKTNKVKGAIMNPGDVLILFYIKLYLFTISEVYKFLNILFFMCFTIKKETYINVSFWYILLNYKPAECLNTILASSDVIFPSPFASATNASKLVSFTFVPFLFDTILKINLASAAVTSLSPFKSASAFTRPENLRSINLASAESIFPF